MKINLHNEQNIFGDVKDRAQLFDLAALLKRYIKVARSIRSKKFFQLLTLIVSKRKSHLACSFFAYLKHRKIRL